MKRHDDDSLLRSLLTRTLNTQIVARLKTQNNNSYERQIIGDEVNSLAE